MSTKEVLGLPNSDLVPGVYEGAHTTALIVFALSFFIFFYFCCLLDCAHLCMYVILGIGGLKLWEGSIDLVKALRLEVQNGNISFSGKRVLEVGS